jgi:hypothetical protein
MRSVRGFALLLSLVLVLILTVFAYWILLLAEKHYAASRMLFDSQNARIAADSAAMRLVLQHNVQLPRFFSESSTWSGLELNPLTWNDYRISGNLAVPWSNTGINLLRLQVQKKRSYAKLELPLKQIRFEDFALYSDTPQQLFTSTLFDGLLFVRGGLTIDQQVRFREAVHNDVTPSFYASYRKRNRLWLDFPALNSPALSGSLNLTHQAAPFWQSDHYELDLDHLQVSRIADSWEVKYKGITIGEAETPILAFDRSVHISQSFREISHLAATQTEVPITIASMEDLVIRGSIQSLQTNQQESPLLLYAEGRIVVSSTLAAIRINACLLSSGATGLDAQPGDMPLSNPEKKSWINEIFGSAFVIEPEKKTELLQALQNNQKMVWFRGSIGLKGSLSISPDVTQLHFEACRKIHNPIASFPFVEIVEGKKKWE